jgi:hypothetical protein
VFGGRGLYWSTSLIQILTNRRRHVVLYVSDQCAAAGGGQSACSSDGKELRPATFDVATTKRAAGAYDTNRIVTTFILASAAMIDPSQHSTWSRVSEYYSEGATDL